MKLTQFSFSAFLFISACTLNTSKISSQTIVQVNDYVLTSKDFAEKLSRRLKDFDALSVKDPLNVQRAKEAVVRDFIMQSLVQDFAKIQNITVSETELNAEIDNLRANYPDDLSFRRQLAEENISFTDWRKLVEKTLLDQKVNKKISEKIAPPSLEDLRKYYSDQKDKYRRKERVYLRQIVVDDLTKAEALKEEVKKGDFAKLASKYSVSPEAKNGGLVGWVEKGEVDIFDKAFSLSIGVPSSLLESSYGFHFFKVERKAAPGVAQFEEVKNSIQALLAAKKEQAVFLSWLDQRIRASKVLKNTELIQTISIETRGSKPAPGKEPHKEEKKYDPS